jgi:AhpD family alkylhydroperoxidase
MLDWTDYLRQLLARVSEMGKLSPDTVRGYQTLMAAGHHTGYLDTKTRELIALGCSVTARCDGCITVHANAAAKLGATREEVAEALGVAVALGAGASLVFSMRTLDAFDAHSSAAPAHQAARKATP